MSTFSAFSCKHQSQSSCYYSYILSFFLWFTLNKVTQYSSAYVAAANYLDNVPMCIPAITSDTGRNGSFSSPNHPSAYPGRTHCRYDFIGQPNERVQLHFTDFNLYHPETAFTERDRQDHDSSRKDKEKDCAGADTLSSFVHTSSPTISIARIDDYCGSTTPLAIMSNDHHRLTLEFNAPSSSSYVRGFSGMYTFIEDFGIRTGTQNRSSPCWFVYKSYETSNGTFTSPNFPGLYPRDTTCTYDFQGSESQIVELHFTYFDIDGIQPCEDDSHSDYVDLSNYKNIDRKYDRKCGTIQHGFKVQSDRNFFRVRFYSNDRFDATGFHATYQFSEKPKEFTMRSMRSSTNLNFPDYSSHDDVHEIEPEQIDGPLYGSVSSSKGAYSRSPATSYTHQHSGPYRGGYDNWDSPLYYR